MVAPVAPKRGRNFVVVGVAAAAAWAVGDEDSSLQLFALATAAATAAATARLRGEPLSARSADCCSAMLKWLRAKKTTKNKEEERERTSDESTDAGRVNEKRLACFLSLSGFFLSFASTTVDKDAWR